MSDYLENKLIDWLFRGQAFNVAGATAPAGSGPAYFYVYLFTGNSSDAGGPIEVSGVGTGYQRMPLPTNPLTPFDYWTTTQGTTPGDNTPSSGTGASTYVYKALQYNTATADWGNITSIGLAFSNTAIASQMAFWVNITPVTILAGDKLAIPAGTIIVTLDN